MIKKIVLFSNIFILWIAGSAFAQLTELPFSQKVENATDIFEGKVIRKTCFWNAGHTLIFTANTIEVYKVFKGNIISPEVEIITEGGNIENDMQDTESSLHLDISNIGVFMAEPTAIFNPQTKENKMPIFRTYGGIQGFIKYDLSDNTASDSFRKFQNIQEDVYKEIENNTKQSYNIVKPFSTDNPTGSSCTKESFWTRHFKKKHKKQASK